MDEKTQTISIRLLREGVLPADAVRAGVKLADWKRFKGAKIAIGRMGGEAPAWSHFLSLSEVERERS